MKDGGIREKIGKILEKFREPLKSLKGGFPALLNMAASVFDGLKVKGGIKEAEIKHRKDHDNLYSEADAGTEEENGGSGPSGFAKFGRAFIAKADDFSHSFLGHFPEGKRRPILIALGSLFVLLLVLVISTVAVHSGKPKGGDAPDRMAGIPHEELFYPIEPDFLPKFLLEREPKNFWTADDTQPYWKSPAHSEFWQNEIKTSVDNLMEGVP